MEAPLKGRPQFWPTLWGFVRHKVSDWWEGIGQGQSYRKLTTPYLKSPFAEYQMAEDQTDINEAFATLKTHIYDHTKGEKVDYARNPQLPAMFWEAGKLSPGRPYFFVKPQNRRGWLIERSGNGWAISRSEKILDRDLFLRDYDPWDIVTVYEHEAGTGVKVSSIRRGGELLGVTAYQRMLTDAIMKDAVGQAA